MDLNKQMQAVHIQNQTLEIRKVPVPEPGHGQALVKVLLCGICQTDLGLLHGYYNFSGIPGHEFVGQVVRSPEKEDLQGQRVVAEINIGCGSCSFCLQGEQRHCPNRKAVGISGWPGAMAEYICLPLKNLHPLRPEISDYQAVFSEPLAAALRITQQVHILNQTKIAVLGDGKLGILCALSLRHFSSKVFLLGRHEHKLSLADRQGVKTIQVKKNDSIKEISNKLGWFDLVVEASGSAQGLRLALGIVRPQGTVLLKTTTPDDSRLNTSLIAVNELKLIGSRCGEISQALYFLNNNWLDPLPLIEAEYPLQEFEQAFARAGTKGSMKVLIRLGPG